MSNFGKTLKELRREKQFTQQELAFLLKTSKSAIAQWEQGKRNPSLENVISIARLFEVSDVLLASQVIADIKQKTA